MSKYDFEGEFDYIEDELEFEEFLQEHKRKKIILFSVLGSLLIAFILLLILVENPVADQSLTLKNDFDNIEISDYYPEND